MLVSPRIGTMSMSVALLVSPQSAGSLFRCSATHPTLQGGAPFHVDLPFVLHAGGGGGAAALGWSGSFFFKFILLETQCNLLHGLNL